MKNIAKIGAIICIMLYVIKPTIYAATLDVKHMEYIPVKLQIINITDKVKENKEKEIKNIDRNITRDISTIKLDNKKPTIQIEAKYSNLDQSIVCKDAYVYITDLNLKEIKINDKNVAIREDCIYKIDTKDGMVNIFAKDKFENEAYKSLTVQSKHNLIGKVTCMGAVKCKDCGYIEKAPDGLTHEYGEETVKTPATCTKNEIRVVSCIYCKKEKTREVLNTALGHDITDFSVVKKPTCKEEGTAQRHCTRCVNCNETKKVPVLIHKEETCEYCLDK